MHKAIKENKNNTERETKTSQKCMNRKRLEILTLK